MALAAASEVLCSQQLKGIVGWTESMTTMIPHAVQACSTSRHWRNVVIVMVLWSLLLLS